MPGIQILEEKLKSHCKEDKQFQAMILGDIKGLKETVTTIKDNHLSHIHEEITKLKVVASDNSTDIKWLKKIQWAALVLGITTLVGIVVNTYLTIQ
jgi:hypothetical protein